MVASEIFIKLLYLPAKKIAKLFAKETKIHFFATEELDYLIFRNVHKLLPKVEIVAKSKALQKLLSEKYAAKSLLYPSFPDVLITARHCLHYYPDQSIIRIGMRHGPYHFKDFISAKSYNKFDLFLLTSEKEVEQANAIGIKSAQCGGFPKADSLFGTAQDEIAQFKKNIFSGSDKPTLLFSSTWNSSGLSGVHFWYDKLHHLVNDFNIFVTLHPWVDKSFVGKIRSTAGVHFVESKDLSRYMQISDVLISDTSSIIAEYLLLEKPIITFEIPKQGRLSQEIIDMLERATFRIKNFDQLAHTIKTALDTPLLHAEERKKSAQIMFANDLGNHSQLAATQIIEYLAKRRINVE